MLDILYCVCFYIVEFLYQINSSVQGRVNSKQVPTLLIIMWTYYVWR